MSDGTSDQLAAAEKRIAELEAALAPFARMVVYFDVELGGSTDGKQLNVYDPDSATLGDARRAAALLAKRDRLRKPVGGLEAALAEYADLVERQSDLLAQSAKLALSLSERVLKQSELLAKRAEG